MRDRIVSMRPYFASSALLLGSIVVLGISIGSNISARQQLAQVSRRSVSRVGIPRTGDVLASGTAAVLPPAPAPAQPLKAEVSTGLTAELNKWAARQPRTQQWGIVVQGIDDPTVHAGVHANTSFSSASIFKLYLVFALAKLVPYNKWQSQHIDATHSYADCVRAMMVYSDNQCAVEIGNKLGWNKVSAMLGPAGYIHTSLKADPTPTTPADTAQLLTDLYSRKGFDNDSAAFVLDAMAHSTFRKGIAAGCPDCQAANKTGDNGNNLHDAGVITIGSQHYAIAIFSQGGSQRQIADATKLVRDYLLANQ